MRFDTTIIDLRRAGITLGWVLFVALFVIVDVAQAHGGGLNKSGCHNNRKTGDYHCHRSSYTPRSSFTSSVPRTQLTNPSSSSNRAIEDDKIFGVQVVLKKNHCYGGPLDGQMGPQTIYAIKLFQANVGLDVDGKLNPKTVVALREYSRRTSACL